MSHTQQTHYQKKIHFNGTAIKPHRQFIKQVEGVSLNTHEREKQEKKYLLGDIDSKEGNPPPLFSILLAHLCETPILPSTPLPFLTPEIVMSEPDTPHPSQQNHDPGPPRIIVSQRVSCIVMSKHNRNHCPIRINHLHHH